MKFWEVVKKITDDPTKVAIGYLTEKGWRVELRVETGHSRYFKFNVFDGSREINQSCPGGAFNGNVAVNLEWEIERKMVTWQDAIKSWACGNVVSVEVGGCKFRLTHDDSIFSLSGRMINIGTWYVEEQ